MATQEPQHIVAKLYGREEANGAFFVRLFFAIFHECNFIYSDKARNDLFVQLYKPVFDTLFSFHKSGHSLLKSLKAHSQNMQSGQAISFNGFGYSIEENINAPAQKDFSDFLNHGYTAIHDLQKVLKFMSVDISFLYQKQPKFEAGIKALELTEPYLTQYLIAIRNNWWEEFANLRNKSQHSSWRLPDIKYDFRDPIETTEILLPRIGSVPVDQYIELLINRLSLFVEEILMWAFIKKYPPAICLIDMPPSARNPDAPFRFEKGLDAQGVTSGPPDLVYCPEPWVIKYTETDEFYPPDRE